MTPPWWQQMVLYQDVLPSLRDGNGDGIGDLAGLIDSLDYLSGTLGVDAVWVGPFFRSPLLDGGYDIVDHCSVDPRFGDLEIFDRLLREAHDRDLKVIVDYVPNHTSDQHPWFVESRSSRLNPKRDWYIWVDRPNNWMSEAGGSVWESDAATGQFYLHTHLKEQPDLNWRNPEVRKAMLDVLRYWLDRGVDGVRIDVVHLLMKDPELRDNPPNPEGELNPYDIQHADFTTQLHIHDRMHPDLHGVLREIRSVLDGYAPERVAIGEVGVTDWDSWARYFGRDLDGLHLPFAFALIETPWWAAALLETLTHMQAALPGGAWPIFALGNHDRPRLASRLGPAQARTAAVLLLTLPGTPTLFYGDEIGLQDQPVPPELQRDHFGLAAGGASRDPVRTPMPWNDGPNGGFAADGAPELWLPISAEYQTVNVESQLADPESLLNLYRHLLALRRSSPALRSGHWEALPGGDDECLVYRRYTDNDRKIVALNLTGRKRTVIIPDEARIVLSTLPRRQEGNVVPGPLTLGPDESLVLEVTAYDPG